MQDLLAAWRQGVDVDYEVMNRRRYLSDELKHHQVLGVDFVLMAAAHRRACMTASRLACEPHPQPPSAHVPCMHPCYSS